jgi:hypothetical protein
MKVNKILSVVCFANYAISMVAIPKHVLIIRHAELTLHHEAVFNFRGWRLHDISLRHTKPLSPRGWQRAYGLVPFFTMQPEMMQYGDIVALFAPKPNQDYNSVRPIQTLTPLSEKLKKRINLSCTIDQGGNLAHEIMTDKEYNNKTVLIAYEHMHIARLAQLFDQYAVLKSDIKKQSSGVNVQRLETESLVPAQWGLFQDGTAIFDQVWVLTFDIKTGKIIDFANVAQELLYQDSSDPFNQRPELSMIG